MKKRLLAAIAIIGIALTGCLSAAPNTDAEGCKIDGFTITTHPQETEYWVNVTDSAEYFYSSRINKETYEALRNKVGSKYLGNVVWGVTYEGAHSGHGECK